MFLLVYNVNQYNDGSGSNSVAMDEFETLKAAEKAKTEKMIQKKYSRVQIYTPLGHENIDYKEKFEELYNHLLTQSGIRLPAKKEAIKATVK